MGESGDVRWSGVMEGIAVYNCEVSVPCARCQRSGQQQDSAFDSHQFVVGGSRCFLNDMP